MIPLLLTTWAMAKDPVYEVEGYFAYGLRLSAGGSSMVRNAAIGGTTNQIWPGLHLAGQLEGLYLESAFLPDTIAFALGLRPFPGAAQLAGDANLSTLMDFRATGWWLVNPRDERRFGLSLDVAGGVTTIGHGSLGRGLTVHAGPALAVSARVGDFILQSDARIEPGFVKLGGVLSSASNLEEIIKAAPPNVRASVLLDVDHKSGLFLHLRAQRALSWDSRALRVIRYDVGIGYRLFEKNKGQPVTAGGR